jgi:hypothetical protein
MSSNIYIAMLRQVLIQDSESELSPDVFFHDSIIASEARRSLRLRLTRCCASRNDSGGTVVIAEQQSIPHFEN